MAVLPITLLVLSLLVLSPKSSSFSFPSFHRDLDFDSQIALFGDAAIVDENSSIQITRPSVRSSGIIVYKKSISFVDPNPKRIASISTHFSFSVAPGSDGIALVFFPAKSTSQIEPPELLQRSVCVVAVNIGDVSPAEESNGPIQNCSRIVSIHGSLAVNLGLDGGKVLHCWVDYDSGLKKLEVRLNKSSLLWPPEPFISYTTDFPEMWKSEMFVGISSASENSTRTSSVYSWSFELKRDISSIHSEPVDPQKLLHGRDRSVPRTSSRARRILTAVVFGVGCGAGVAFLVLYARSMFAGKPSPPAKECPLRPMDFDYKKITAVASKDADAGKKQEA